ncbi:MAG: hypothetical protein ACJAS1_001842 [Oleiphilaceae bacterium]|jgi:hypothetical protein
MSKIKILSFMLLMLMLSACGGSDSPGNANPGVTDNSGGVNSGNITYVVGDFKTANDPSQYYPSDAEASGLGAEECIVNNNYHYFESENVLVYGDSSLPNSDYQFAATAIENNLDKAFGLMGITRTDFDNYRPQYTSSVGNNIIRFIEWDDRDVTDIVSEFVVPDGWSEMESYARKMLLKGYWNSISDEKQNELIALFDQGDGYSLTEGYVVPEKIIVCLDPKLNEVLYGQGTLLGMNIAAKSQSSRSDAEQVILHELIHTIQLNISTPMNSSSGINDIWFMEGQATFLAGQKTAASASGFYPVDVVHWIDADTVFQDNLGVAYEHYAKAYSYIDAYSGKDRALELLIDVRHYQGDGEIYAGYGVSSDRFSEAFNANMLKKNGEQLTIQDFRSNYHTLMNNQ